MKPVVSAYQRIHNRRKKDIHPEGRRGKSNLLGHHLNIAFRVPRDLVRWWKSWNQIMQPAYAA